MKGTLKDYRKEIQRKAKLPKIEETHSLIKSFPKILFELNRVIPYLFEDKQKSKFGVITSSRRPNWGVPNARWGILTPALAFSTPAPSDKRPSFNLEQAWGVLNASLGVSNVEIYEILE
ncbi:hypothetical protein PIB30_096391, partial [Stylosanthes scabra]|nr:hypothetical protein [Stylosanthes scabra]